MLAGRLDGFSIERLIRYLSALDLLFALGRKRAICQCIPPESAQEG
ncbi:MAG: hypothetical protein JXA87_14755 [Thermoleophilia bacterium]|nr:hypothetical protein [Thermoleophilia bacterium]